MTITLTPDIEGALAEEASQRGTTLEALVLETLRAKFLRPKEPVQSSVEARDRWEAMVLNVGRDCAVSLDHEALSSEGLYE